MPKRRSEKGKKKESKTIKNCASFFTKHISSIGSLFTELFKGHISGLSFSWITGSLAITTWLLQYSNKKSGIYRVGIYVFTGLILVFSVYFARLQYSNQDSADPPLVSLATGATFDKSNVFAKALLIKNQNRYAISNISYSIYWQDIATYGKSVWLLHVDETLIDSIEPLSEYAITPDPVFRQLTLTPEKKGYFHVEIFFKAKPWHETNSAAFRICVMVDADGSHVFNPAGHGKTILEIAANTNNFILIFPSVGR